MPRLTSYSVSLPRLDNPQSVSDKPQTMGGRSSAPNRIASQTIYNRANRNALASAIKKKADGNSNIGFARLCFVQQFGKGHTNTLKLSAGLRTQSVECSRLGKTRIIKDAGRGMVRNTGFYGQICLGQISSGTFGSYFSWYHS